MASVTPTFQASAEHELFIIEDLSGGWNCVDAPTQVAPNESPDLMNKTLDERGGAVDRLGLERLTALLAGVGQALFYWETEDLLIFQVGDRVYKTADWSSLTEIKAFTTSDGADFADFLGKLVMVHPQDGIWTYTTAGGLVHTSGGTNNMEAVRGNTIVSWQNALFVGGDPRADFKTYVWRSALGDPHSWDVSSTGDWIAVRTKDDAAITNLGVAEGQDVQGRPGLIVCKDESCYRIYDAATLDYTVLHTKAGAAGRMALTSLHGYTCFLNRHGIWRTDGVNEPELVSKKIQRLFREEQLAFGSLSKCAAGVKDDRIVFSVPRITDSTPAPTVNNFTLEYHPLDGWIVPHDFGIAAYATFGGDASRLHGLSASESKAFEVFSGGTDDGVAIATRYQTKWHEPKPGQKCRFRRARVRYRGAQDVYALRDFDETLGTADASLAAILTAEGETDVWSLGVGRFFALEVRNSASAAATLPKLLGDGVGAESGASAFYGFVLDHIPLGLA